MKFIVISLIGIIMFSTLAAAMRIMRKPYWRKCRRCRWYYDDQGNLSTNIPPGITGWDVGLCHTCEKIK